MTQLESTSPPPLSGAQSVPKDGAEGEEDGQGLGGFEGFPQVALIRPHPEGHLDSRGGHRSNHQFTFKMLL